MPAIYWWEYKFGYWALQGHFPHRIRLRNMSMRDYMNWTTFFTVGQPLLVGSLFLALPSALVVYLVCRPLVKRARVQK